MSTAMTLLHLRGDHSGVPLWLIDAVVVRGPGVDVHLDQPDGSVEVFHLRRVPGSTEMRVGEVYPRGCGCP